MSKVGLTNLLDVFSDLKKKALSDQMFRILIRSLWRDPVLLRHEKAITIKDNEETGYIQNKMGEDILYGYAEGQNNLIEGERSAAFGQGHNTKSYLETILGAHALIPEGQNATEWIPTDLLLTLGNGTDPEHRSNVFEIFKNGIIRFIFSIVIGAHPELPEGETPRPGSVQFIENKLMLYYLGEWHDLATIQDIYNIINIELNNPTTNIYQSVTNIVNQQAGASHESYLINNTANTSETIVSTWTVVPWAEQVGEFKAVIMVRNKVTNTIVTLISLLSFDYSDATDVVVQNDLLTDTGITLTVGVNAENYLFATVSGMPTVNKRIHICFERCVLSHREYTISAEGNFELNGSADASAIVAMQPAAAEFDLSLNAVLTAMGLLSAAANLELNGSATLVNNVNPCLASLPNNLIAYYKLDETSGDMIDSIGGVNLTVNGSVSRGATGKLGNCLYFPGTSADYCSGNTPLAGKKEWTISFWLKMHRSQTADQGIISGISTNPAFTPNVIQKSTSKLSTGWSNSSFNFTASIDSANKDIDTWYLITQRGYLDVATDTLYYKGSINTTHQNYANQTGASFTDIQGTLVLGRHAKYTTQAFQGWIDDIKIWDRQLTDCEINANYNDGNGVEL